MHVSALAQYLTAAVAPRGLRIRIKPATTELSPSNMNKWKQVLDKASLQLTEIILNHYETTAHSLRKKEELLSQELSKRELNLLSNYESKTASAISRTKDRKFNRDKISNTGHMRKNLTSSGTSNCPNSDNTADNVTTTVINASTTATKPVQLNTGINNFSSSAVTKENLTRNVLSLSKITLSPVHMNVVSKGLSSCMASGGFDEFPLFHD